MDPITITAAVVAGGILVADYLRRHMITSRINVLKLLEENYKPEACDIEMRNKCLALLEEEFPYPQELCMWDRIHMAMKDLSYVDRKEMIAEVFSKVTEVMRLEPAPELCFEELAYLGVYNSEEDKVYLSSSLLEDDNECVEIFRTIFHELKHTVQIRAVREGGNVWGYSDDQLAEWALNNLNYINPHDDPEGYVRQSMEMDSFGFEVFILQNPSCFANFQFLMQDNDADQASKSH